VFTVRAAFGLSALALTLWASYYSVYFTGRRYPRWLFPAQGDDGRMVAGMNLTAIVAALAVLVGSGTGWLVAGLMDWDLPSGRVAATAVVAGAAALSVVAPSAWRRLPRDAARIDQARTRRLASKGEG